MRDNLDRENYSDAENAKKIVEQYNFSKERLLSILLEIQKQSGKNYVPEESARVVAELLKMPVSHLYDVITFYSMFSLKPRGKYLIELCKSPSCHVSKSGEIAKIFEDTLGIGVGQTTVDNIFTLEYTSCFGACDIGPAVKIGDKIYGNLNVEEIHKIIKDYRGDEGCQK